MTPSTQYDAQPGERPAASPGRFDLLLIIMVSAYLLSALTGGRWTEVARVVLFTAVALLAIRNSVLPRRTAGLIVTAVLAGSAIMLALWFITETGKGIANRPVLACVADLRFREVGRVGLRWPPRSGRHACWDRDRAPARAGVTYWGCSAFCRQGGSSVRSGMSRSASRCRGSSSHCAVRHSASVMRGGR